MLRICASRSQPLDPDGRRGTGRRYREEELARAEQYVKWLKEQVVFTRERMAFTEKNQ